MIASIPKKHAKNRPPSSASRYISCPGSVTVVPQYPNEESEAAIKGTQSHTYLEEAVIFDVAPRSADEIANEQIEDMATEIRRRRDSYSNCTMYIEETLDVPETGDFGTADVILVSPSCIEVIDAKFGYVPVDIRMNAQLMTYLLAAIAKYGERKSYNITIMQPNYVHVDGPYRSQDVTQDDVEWFRQETLNAVASSDFRPGKHCKKTYCPHRGSCATFALWAIENKPLAWGTSEINSIPDDMLAEHLDYYDTIKGHGDSLRREAINRILNMNKKIPGFKLIQRNGDRVIVDKEAVAAKLIQMGIGEEKIYHKNLMGIGDIENAVREYAKPYGRGVWRTMWDNNFSDYIQKPNLGFQLERDISGVPEYRRGVEFPDLPPENSLGNIVI